ATEYWFWEPSEEEKWPYDLERAEQLLEDAGYKYIGSEDVRENETSGVELDFSFYYRSGKIADEKAAQQISIALAQIGIRADPEPLSEMNLYNYWYGCKYDLYIWAWDTDVDPSFMLSVMTTDQIPDNPQDFTAWSDCFWSNAEYDAMYEDQLYAVDREERQAIIHDMQKLMYIECPYVVLYYPRGLYAYNIEKFTNYPDMLEEPGSTPGTMWFFFDVTPSSQWVDPKPPTDVYAGSDRSCVVGQTLSFTGSATDENDPLETLTWEWLFEDIDGDATRTGQTVGYTFENIGLINVTLTVTDPGGLSATDTLVVNVTEPLENSGWITGYVKTPGDLPVVGATVTAGASSQETNLTGAYQINIVAGTYTVNASKSGYTSASEEVVVVANETVWQNFTISATSGTIKGRVLNNETGAGILGATVKVTVGSQVKTFSSNATGYFEFNNVPAGVYTVNATKSGFIANGTNVTVVAGEAANVSIYLEPEPEEESGGLSTAAIAAIGLVVVAAIALTAAYVLKKRKSGSPPEGDVPGDEPPPPS
ncbi:TPA: PKD domain-containing protein, partial [Thermoplasmata archaeon]|nr:PKD domain-containing protein [Thermoplasmata archaeon]